MGIDYDKRPEDMVVYWSFFIYVIEKGEQRKTEADATFGNNSTQSNNNIERGGVVINNKD